MATYEELFDRNKKWVEERLKSDKDFFNNLAKGQEPDYLYIGCSDSRVPANEIMGLGAGEVFVHRNVANLVNSTDLNVMAVINYAVRYLKVKHIIVCGHYNCGGVKAAMQSEDLGILNPWLRNIRDVYRLHNQELNAIEDLNKRYNRLIEINVEEQCLNVIKTAAVQLSYVGNGFPVVHGWVFDLKDGYIKDLEIGFERKLQEIQQIYNLTGKDLKYFKE
jgi:carbonic anhydrase